ncbi:serine/threonine-protein kinase Nek11-like isoform X2 [Anneissia japonica]|uniref:serine/threonine-protein kinase Nek11-like isoform X2 n=1 Tax=Anneissia japonica TaxID=1529436 RepID=UPI0014257B34|nr:serine/threonine-protein kinase Nek11-like isoform X2 [Anneissia japonica]
MTDKAPQKWQSIPDRCDEEANDFYFRDELEPDTDGDLGEEEDDLGNLINIMQDTLDLTVQDHNATTTDDTVGVFSPTVCATKINDLRIECEMKLGKDAFRKAYAFLKDAKFDKKDGMATLDENAIKKGLRQFVHNPSDCSLVDKLLFLEEQAKIMKCSTNVQTESSSKRRFKEPKKETNKHRVLANRYRVERELDSGSFATVFLVSDIKANNVREHGEWKAMKRIICSYKTGLSVQHEADVLLLLKHPNVVRFYDSFVDGGMFYIITEYCEDGDLDKKIKAWKKEGKLFDQEVVMDWFVQLIRGLQYIHKRDVIHRDLKPANVFLKNNMIKIGDVGISRVLTGADSTWSFVGTPCYMCPEIMEGKMYNNKCDIWAVGCILFEICALRCAFEGDNFMNKIFNVQLPDIPQTYHQDVQELIHILIVKDPIKRPSATEILDIAFVARHLEPRVVNNPDVCNDAAFQSQLLPSIQ